MFDQVVRKLVEDRRRASRKRWEAERALQLTYSRRAAHRIGGDSPDDPCDISPRDGGGGGDPDNWGYSALLLNYDPRTGHWSNEDILGDSNGYGHASGFEDGSTDIDENDCELWFDITQNDKDGDGLTWWQECGPDNPDAYGTDPTSFDRTWLFMVYMAADNDIEDDAIRDFNEMETVGSTDFVNIVVQLDRGTDEDTSTDNWVDTRRFYIRQDNDVNVMSSPVVQNIGEANMGNPDSLVNFTRWATTSYPANTLALVLWDHGHGFEGICDDDTSDDILDLNELSQALNTINIILERKLDIIGFDACLMGTVEVGYQIRGTADIIIASESTVPGNAWPYEQILLDLINNEQMTIINFAATIVNEYITSYNDDISTNHVTLSAFWINDIYLRILPAMVNLAQKLYNNLPTYQQEIITARENSESYPYFPNRDLYDFAYEVNQLVNDENIQIAAQNVMTSIIDSCLIERHLAGKPDSHGISIYWPIYTGEYKSEYENIDFAHATEWDELLRAIGP